jgi:hypothetical protein
VQQLRASLSDGTNMPNPIDLPTIMDSAVLRAALHPLAGHGRVHLAQELRGTCIPAATLR